MDTLAVSGDVIDATVESVVSGNWKKAAITLGILVVGITLVSAWKWFGIFKKG